MSGGATPRNFARSHLSRRLQHNVWLHLLSTVERNPLPCAVLP